MIQYQMFRIRGFRTILEKVDEKTGERFIYGNERLLTAGALKRGFADHGVTGTSELFRFLPTALCTRPGLVRAARALEIVGLETMLLPACIHCVFFAEKSV